MTQIISIGYEQRSITELIDILKDHHVERLLDVRELPLSRRKGFSKKALSSSLEEAGIEYQHLRAAGNPHRKLKGSIQQCLQLYGSHLEEHPEIIELVGAELSEAPIAMLCYERQHDECHRSVLLDKLNKFGYPIEIIRT